MQTQPIFSVITPTLNCGHKLETTFTSVLRQQDRSLYEYIVVDGASTDDTLEVCERYAGEIKWVSERDGGIYQAFNRGIDLARGKYLYFLGAGDTLHAGVLAQIAQLVSLSGTPPAALIHGDVFLVKDGVRFGRKFSKSFLRRRNLPHQGVFYARDLFDRLGKYDARYFIYADYAFNLKCFADRDVEWQYVPLLIADYEGGGISETQTDHAFLRDFPRLLKETLGTWQYLLLSEYRARVVFHDFRQNIRQKLKVARKSAPEYQRRVVARLQLTRLKSGGDTGAAKD